MKKLFLAGMVSTLALGLVVSTPHAAQASWVAKSFDKLGLKMKVNDTFKVTESTDTEVEMKGTIYGKDSMIYLTKDTSKDWSKVSQKDIIAAFVKEPRNGVSNLKITDQSSKDGGIGDQKGASWVSFTDTSEGENEHGFMEYGVKDGALYEFEIYYIGDDKALDAANNMMLTVNFTDSDE